MSGITGHSKRFTSSTYPLHLRSMELREESVKVEPAGIRYWVWDQEAQMMRELKDEQA